MTRFYNTKTEEIASRLVVEGLTKKRFPTSREPNDSDLEGTDWVILHFSEAPETEDLEIAEQGTPELLDDEWHVPWVVRDRNEDELASLKGQLVEGLQAYRWSRYSTEFDFNGVKIEIDQVTEGRILAAGLKSLIDPNYVVRNWRINGVYQELNAAFLAPLGEALDEHIQTWFDAQAPVEERILSGESDQLTNLEDIKPALDQSYLEVTSE